MANVKISNAQRAVLKHLLDGAILHSDRRGRFGGARLLRMPAPGQHRISSSTVEALCVRKLIERVSENWPYVEYGLTEGGRIAAKG